jgi:membrane-associated phospholipid phosphatase
MNKSDIPADPARANSRPASPSEEFPRAFPWQRMLPAAVAAALALTLLPFAEPLHRAVYATLMWLPLSEFFSTTRQFAGTTAILTLLAVIFVFDPPRRRTLVALLVAMGIAAVANESIKQVTGRTRPSRSVLLEEKDRLKLERYIAEHPGTPVRTDGRDNWLLFKNDRPYFKDDFSSFPSGHANTAFVIAAFLIIVYPRGRWIWLLLAVGCALARVRFRRHFPEDILFGGALGWVMAHWVFSWGWPMRLAARLETVFQRKGASKS